jgi:hypothetical protein
VSHGPDPVFFLDRNFGRNIAPAALRQAGFTVEVMDDHFPPDTPDDVWLKEVGKRGWFVVTLDERIRYRRLEQDAVRLSKVGMFLLVRWKGSTGQALAEALIAARAGLMRLVAKQSRPFIAKVYRDGGVALWVPFTQY